MSDPPAETATMTQRSPADRPATVSSISAPVGAGRPFPVSALPGFVEPGSPAVPGKLAEQAAYRNEVVVVHPAAGARLKVPDQPGAGVAVEGANQVGAYVPAPPGT